MSKTPEEMAEEYADSGLYRLKRYVDGRIKPVQGQHGLQHLACRNGFLAGYQAAKEQLADADKVMNSSNISNGWISVKDRLPGRDDGITQLWMKYNSLADLVLGCHSTMQIDGKK